MSGHTRIVTATPASVLGLLEQVERRWPVQEDTKAEDSTYRKWHSEAHEAISYGLMTLSSSYWEHTDKREESKLRRFPAYEFDELRNCLVRSLIPRGGQMPAIESLNLESCDNAMREIEEHSASPGLHKPSALVTIPLLLIELSRQLCTNLNHGEEDYSVEDYVRIVNATGWRSFRRHVCRCFCRQWSSFLPLQQYRSVFDLLNVEDETKDWRYSPIQLWHALKRNFDTAMSYEGHPTRHDEILDHCKFPYLIEILCAGEGVHQGTIPTLMPIATLPSRTPSLDSSSSVSSHRSASPPRGDRSAVRVRRSPSPHHPRRSRSRSLAHLSYRKQGIYSALL